MDYPPPRRSISKRLPEFEEEVSGFVSAAVTGVGVG